MRSLGVVVISVVVAVSLAACGTGTPLGAATSEPTADVSTATPTATPTDDPTDNPIDDAPAFPERTARQYADPSGEWDLVFTDVHVSAHEGFDRIVVELAGTGTPGWTVNYVDEATLDGSGEVVALEGEAVLDVYASGTTWPAAGYYSGPRRLRCDGGDIDGHVAEVFVAGTFEGYTQVLAGIDGPRRPFRVFALTAPPRLVVDVVD